MTTTSKPTTAYVGLGSNLGDREATLRRALDLLEGHVRVSAVSSFRETDPVGVTDQPRFVNAVAQIETHRSAPDLLAALLGVERELGRVRRERWGPRGIDLDLLLFGGETIDEPGLTVPHPHLHDRRFVLEPLAELDAGLVVPGRGNVCDLLARLD